MNRLSLGFVAAIAVTGCGPKEFGSLCDQVPAPAACMTACDPAPGAPATCPSGYHCAPDGFCDTQCTPNSAECGEGYVCTDDGRCVDDGSPGSNGPDASCPAVVFTPMPKTPSIMLVLDRSGSMDGSDIAPNRYDAMVEALVGTSGVVTQLQNKAYFGSALYGCSEPSGGVFQFDVIPRALNNAGAIRNVIEPFDPFGNTPTPEAINAAVQNFQANPPPADSPPAIVLATDGLPNACPGGASEGASVNAARAAYAAGIPVYVLAINQTSSHFQDLANAGQGWVNGQPDVPYYPVSNASQLQSAFQTIINGVISCDLSLTASIDEGQAMNGTLTINGVQQQYGSDWILVGGNTIRVQGSACTTLKTTQNPNVQATFPCGSIIF
ncbi:MAG: vWA domain-containing protein [Kofleriaceae bacterium]|nr:vWA domain-containing protein [Kofleriaceae bacterium]